MGRSKEVPQPENSEQVPRNVLTDALRTMQMDKKTSKEINAMFDKAIKEAMVVIESIEDQQKELHEISRIETSDAKRVFNENSCIRRLYDKNIGISINDALIVYKAYKAIDRYMPHIISSVNRAKEMKADFIGRFENSARPGKPINPERYHQVIERMDDIIHEVRDNFEQLSSTKKMLSQLYSRGFHRNIGDDVRNNQWEGFEVVEEENPENKEIQALFERTKEKTTGKISSIIDKHNETMRVASEGVDSVTEKVRVAKEENAGRIVESDASILFTADRTFFDAQKNIIDNIKSAKESRDAFKMMFENSVMKREISSKIVYDVIYPINVFINRARDSLRELSSTRADLHKLLQDSGLSAE